MSLMKRYWFLGRFFSLRGGKIIANYRVPGKIPSLRLQYRFFKTRFSKDILLLQVGRHYEFYPDDGDMAHMLGLKAMLKPKNRNTKYGFPVRLENVFLEKIRECKRTVTVIGEQYRYLTRVKEYSLVFQQ
jgi:hypothetical protein